MRHEKGMNNEQRQENKRAVYRTDLLLGAPLGGDGMRRL